MSRVTTIPRSSWADYARSFSQQHAGWLVTLERSDGHTPQLLAEEIPLQAVRIDHRDQSEVIEIAVGDAPDRTALHHLQGVTEILVVSAENNPNAIERLESRADGHSLTLRFRTTIAPELVDGFAGGIE